MRSSARWAVGLVAVTIVVGCARKSSEPRVASDAPPEESSGHRLPDTFAIYAVDDLNDITIGLEELPAGFEVFHEKAEPKNGYVYASLENESQATMLERLREWSAGLALPEGDNILFGKTTRQGVRTYLVKGTPVLDAGDVVGAMAYPSAEGEWAVALTFTRRAAQSLTGALGEPGRHFRIVVQGFVEQDLFELVDERSSDAIAGAHGGLSTTDWICSSHRALLRMLTRNAVPAKTRASSLAKMLPSFRDARECRRELVSPAPETQHGGRTPVRWVDSGAPTQ